MKLMGKVLLAAAAAGAVWAAAAALRGRKQV